LAPIRGPRSPIRPRGAVPVAVARCCPGTSFVVRSTGLGVPAQAAASATHGAFSAGDTDTTASVLAGTSHTASLSPAASSPTPVACSPDGDTARG
jgi:hypothetical protein